MTIVWSYIILLDFICSNISNVEMFGKYWAQILQISLRYVGQSSFQVSFYLWLLWARSLWSAAYDARKKNHIYFPSSSLPFFLLFYPWSSPPLHVFAVTQTCLILLSLPWTVAHQAPLSMGFPRQEYGVGSHFLLQGIFPTQELNPCLLHCRQILYRWAIHLRSPHVLCYQYTIQGRVADVTLNIFHGRKQIYNSSLFWWKPVLMTLAFYQFSFLIYIVFFSIISYTEGNLRDDTWSLSIKLRDK